MRAKVVKGLVVFVVAASVVAAVMTVTDVKNVMGTNTDENTVHYETWEEFEKSGVQIEYAEDEYVVDLEK